MKKVMILGNMPIAMTTAIASFCMKDPQTQVMVVRATVDDVKNQMREDLLKSKPSIIELVTTTSDHMIDTFACIDQRDRGKGKGKGSNKFGPIDVTRSRFRK